MKHGNYEYKGNIYTTARASSDEDGFILSKNSKTGIWETHVVYSLMNDTSMLFTREVSDFKKKFKLIGYGYQEG